MAGRRSSSIAKLMAQAYAPRTCSDCGNPFRPDYGALERPGDRFVDPRRFRRCEVLCPDCFKQWDAADAKS